MQTSRIIVRNIHLTAHKITRRWRLLSFHGGLYCLCQLWSSLNSSRKKRSSEIFQFASSPSNLHWRVEAGRWLLRTQYCQAGHKHIEWLTARRIILNKKSFAISSWCDTQRGNLRALRMNFVTSTLTVLRWESHHFREFKYVKRPITIFRLFGVNRGDSVWHRKMLRWLYQD